MDSSATENGPKKQPEPVMREEVSNQRFSLTHLCFAILFFAVSFLGYKVFSMEQVSAQPAVLVVDFMAIAEKYPVDATDAEVERQIHQVHNAIQKLADAGYVILDSSNVLKAPESAYLNDLYELATQSE